MEKLILNAEVRTTEETMKELKVSKKLAWVVYGKNKETISIKLDYSEFLKTFRKSWESQIISLKIGKEEIEVLVHQIQNHPISSDFIHIDFYAITRWEKLTTKISLNFVWSSEAVKEWAIIDEHLKEIEVKCLPRNLVDSFEVDLSTLLEMWDSIRVSDLIVDTEKFEILTNESDIIVAATKPAKVEEITDEAPEAPIDETEEETTEEEK